MKTYIVLLSILITTTYAVAQIYPVTLKQRVEESSTIAIVTVKEKLPYWDQEKANIYTLNVLQVMAYLKGYSEASEIAMITEGGVVEDQAQKSWPETKLRPQKQYIVFLNEDNFIIDHREYRNSNPNTIQCTAVARVQGAITLQDGVYIDALVEAPQTEEEILNKIENILREKAKAPDGTHYAANSYIEEQVANSRDAFTITSIEDGFGTMAPGPFIGGTIVTGNELVIKASGGGFGATQGTGKVEFANADDGGATMIEPPNASDYVSWSDTEIRVKIPSDAGTGDVKVTDGAGFMDTYSSITIKWAMNVSDSDFYFWPAVARNRIELVEDNGAGGYTFAYSTVGGMASNTAAKAAFERALSTWRCSTFVNFDVSLTSTGDGFADDGTNVVMFASLSGSTLGVMTSRYTANGTGGCDMEDTFWRVKELDVRFDDSGTTWYYGSGGCPGGAQDFESVALHEIGHGHGLGHINDASKVMNYSISSCSIMHALSADEVEAGDHKMDHSETANCLGPPTYPDVITPVSMAACNLLPVELIAFSAKPVDDMTELNWQTATEIDNDYFTLERSSDGRNFKAIATIKGAGTSYEKQGYTFIDRIPEMGTNYYRLSQMDFDGTKTIHDKIVSVDFSTNAGIEIRPNPVFNEQFQLVYEAKQSGDLEIEIYDIAGALVFKNKYGIEKALNYIDISIPELSNGVYIIKAKKKNTIYNLRFVKAGG